MKPSVKITAADIYLPERIRTQQDWPADVVASWKERLGTFVPTNKSAVSEVTEGVQLSLDAIAALKSDPFQGVETVHVIDEKDVSSDLEARAAIGALARAQ